MPVMSSTEIPLPSRCAAIPINALIVMTPVPPMPVIRMLYARSSDGRSGSSNSSSLLKALTATGLIFRGVTPSTVTKLGQKPLMQE